MTVRCPGCGRDIRIHRSPGGRAKARFLERSGGGLSLESEARSPAPAEPEPTEPTDEEETADDLAPPELPDGLSGGPRRDRTWWDYLLHAWAYPFRGETWWGFLVWAAGCALLPWAGFVFVFGLIRLVVSLIFVIVLAGTFALYQFEIVRQSAWDAPRPPRLPEFESLLENAIRPLGLVLAAVFGACLPLLLVAGPMPFWEQPEWWPIALKAAAVLSVFLLPINLLAVAMADSALAVNPRFTLPAVLRIPLSYTVCFLLALAVTAASAGVVYLLSLGGGPGLLARFATAAAVAYLWSVFSRALGTLHYAYEERIGWMQEMD
ncbi:MAG: hypothetical protein R6X33_19350 [Candidatus Brocadiia bacterium]